MTRDSDGLSSLRPVNKFAEFLPRLSNVDRFHNSSLKVCVHKRISTLKAPSSMYSSPYHVPFRVHRPPQIIIG